MIRPARCLLLLLALGACAMPRGAMLGRDDGDVAAYPRDFYACKAEADRLYDPADPAQAHGRYNTVVSCLMARGYTYEPRVR
jgi:hypothetical protein